MNRAYLRPLPSRYGGRAAQWVCAPGVKLAGCPHRPERVTSGFRSTPAPVRPSPGILARLGAMLAAYLRGVLTGGRAGW